MTLMFAFISNLIKNTQLKMDRLTHRDKVYVPPVHHDFYFNNDLAILFVCILSLVTTHERVF